MRRGSRPADRTCHAREAMREFLGETAVSVRAAEIDALPLVVWKGEPLRTARCHGTSGKGPHAVNVPEALLWSLIDVNHWRCPYHANDGQEGGQA